MAEGDGLIYNNFKEQLMEEFFNLASGGDTVELTLHSTYTADIDLHTQWADVSASEISGSGYTAGGETLANQDATQDDANDRGKFDADNVTWASCGPLSTPTPAAAILWDNSAAGDELICSWTLGTTATNGGDYTLAFHGDGIILLT
jgi:hypothetical protein